jgi:hypothetical protein
MHAWNNEASPDRVLHVANTRHSPAPRHLLAMSHVLVDNTVASENRGGCRKFGETEDVAFLKEIVANHAHVCRRGKVAENFEEVARALNEGNALPWNLNGKHCNDRNKLLLANFRRADRARALASGTGEEFGERDQLLADILSAVNDNEEHGRTEREESAKRDERLANSSTRSVRPRRESRPLLSQCSLLFFVLHMEGFAAAARCVASTAPGRRRAAVDARQRLGSSRGALVYAARGDPISPLHVYVHVIVPTWVQNGVSVTTVLFVPTWVRYDKQ